MNERKKLVYEIYRSMFLLLITVTVFVFTTVAWYAKNVKVSNDGISLVVDDPEKIEIKTEVTAIRTILGGEPSTIEFERQADGKLKNKNTQEESSGALFKNMLPSEYVDLTFNINMSEALDGLNFKVYFTDFNVGQKPSNSEEAEKCDGWFAISSGEGEVRYYSVLGIYTCELISMYAHKGEDRTPIKNGDGNPIFLDSYAMDKDSELPVEKEVEICSGTWALDYDYIEITIRITEDFSQFYSLLMESGNNAYNLLSNKKLSIGTLGVTLCDEYK